MSRKKIKINNNQTNNIINNNTPNNIINKIINNNLNNLCCPFLNFQSLNQFMVMDNNSNNLCKIMNNNLKISKQLNLNILYLMIFKFLQIYSQPMKILIIQIVNINSTLLWK